MSNKKFNYEELSLFCFELALMLKSGLPLIEGMELLGDQMDDPSFKRIVLELQRDVTAGENFYTSLSKHKEFPAYMIGIVKIAELSGNLDTEIERLSIHYEKLAVLNNKIARAVTYPMILAGMMVVVISILIVKVIPIFQEILVSMGGDIPPVTAGIFGISSFFTQYAIFIVGLLIVLIGGAFVTLKGESGQKQWKKWLATSRFTRDVQRKILAMRFAQSMSVLLRSGITYEEALGYVAEVLDNAYAKERLLESIEKIKGQDVQSNQNALVTLIEEMQIMPALFVKIVKVGTQTGETEKVFDKLAEIYDVQVDKAITRITAVIEPLLIGILSAIVGIILISVILPIINIISSMG